MGRIVNGRSTCAGIALWAIGCSGRAPANSKTDLIIVVTDDASAGGTAPTPNPGVVNSLDGGTEATDSAVDPDAMDASVCNKPGSAACDAAIGAMCQRIVQCCQSVSSCSTWATDLVRCNAYF